MKSNIVGSKKAGPTVASLVGIVLVTSMLGICYPTVALAQVEEDLSDPDLVLDDDISMDNSPPSIRILSPSACSEPITSAGTIKVSGNAYDPDSGIRKVEAFSHSYPFDGTFPFRIATPSSSGDWSSWSIAVQIYESPTRILVRATDNSGNENWDEVTVDIGQASNSINRDGQDARTSIAFVDPTFTDAAYGIGGFYEFYAKYHGAGFDELITTDLDLMTAEISAYPDRSYYQAIVDRVQASMQPGSTVPIISDVDVHDGFIFGASGENAFKALFMMHNEYVTQQEYDNLKHYVNNGGTLVFVDSNAFYAEVSYDKADCSVTLVKGHDWEFQGDFARRSVSERYEQENREFVGTNYMINALWDPVSFNNVPFNYSHFEENYISNPNVTILHDYDLAITGEYDNPAWHKNATIAAYEMNYGKGKIIGLGIYGQKSAENQEFLDFFDRVVLTRALGNMYQVQAGDNTFPVYWKMNSGHVGNITADSNSRKLVISIEGIVGEDLLRLSLPKDLIDLAEGSRITEDLYSIKDTQTGHVTIPSYDQYNGEVSEGRFLVVATSADGNVQQVNENAIVQEIDHERVIEVPIEAGTVQVEIYGTNVTPEFGLLSAGFILVLGTASLGLMARYIMKRHAL